MNLHFTGHGIIGDNDQAQLEFGAAYRHYHACLMRTVLMGTPDRQQVKMHSAAVEELSVSAHAPVFPPNGLGTPHSWQRWTRF